MGLALGATTMTIAAGACLSFDQLSGGNAADAGGDGSGGSGDGSFVDGAIPDDGSISNDGGTPLGDGACPGTHGAVPIRVSSGASSFCIDATEVTSGDYQSFLDALAAGYVANQRPECAWNTNFAFGGSGDLSLPAVGVNWCDAFAYCEWAGKRMCGAIGGGSVPHDDSIGDPSKSQWLAACAHAPDGGIEAFPYGNAGSATACNGAERDASVSVDVGSLKACVGGYPGLFDMSGNVDEWIDSCDHADGGGDCCVSVGGGFHDYETSCGVGDVPGTLCPGRTRNAQHSDLGIRCCSP